MATDYELRDDLKSALLSQWKIQEGGEVDWEQAEEVMLFSLSITPTASYLELTFIISLGRKS